MDRINFYDLRIQKEDGTTTKINKDYFTELQKKNTTFKEKLEVGDTAKLKGVDYFVDVEYVNYEISNLGIVDYAGRKSDGSERELTLFNQKDIEYKVEKKHVR